MHYFRYETARDVGAARNPLAIDAEPARIFNGTLVCVGHTDGERRHVVHEKVGKVFRSNDYHGIGPARFEVDAHLVEGCVEAVAYIGVRLLGTAGDAGSV